MTKTGAAMKDGPQDEIDSGKEDWRVLNAGHLKGLKLRFARYERWSEEWDHDHCAGCWARISETVPDALREGYATCTGYEHGANYDWVCSECFSTLQTELQRTVVDEECVPMH